MRKKIYHVVPSADDAVNDLAPRSNEMDHFVVNGAVEHSLAFAASYDLVEKELYGCDKKHYRLEDFSPKKQPL